MGALLQGVLMTEKTLWAPLDPEVAKFMQPDAAGLLEPGKNMWEACWCWRCKRHTKLDCLVHNRPTCYECWDEFETKQVELKIHVSHRWMENAVHPPESQKNPWYKFKWMRRWAN